MTTLGELDAGDSARVSGYAIEDAAYRHQLLALGLTPGAQVDVVRLAPLGDPLQLRVRGSMLFLRRSDAAAVVVEKL
ncbi:MAG: ferrous iron transport protein A [Sulfuritalea sp.]|nr:ferrous iron transport protein A [Sulfuritalea sp.]